MNERESVKKRQNLAKRLVNSGATKKYIAFELHTSVRTIQRYIKNDKSID